MFATSSASVFRGASKDEVMQFNERESRLDSTN